jgi:hypothetical protein
MPGKTVTRRPWRCVMIVMPSFAKREHGNPEVIGRRIARQEAL